MLSIPDLNFGVPACTTSALLKLLFHGVFLQPVNGNGMVFLNMPRFFPVPKNYPLDELKVGCVMVHGLYVVGGKTTTRTGLILYLLDESSRYTSESTLGPECSLLIGKHKP